MKKEYDFTEGVRGKYAKRYEKGTNLVLLEPEVAKYFPTARQISLGLPHFPLHKAGRRHPGAGDIFVTPPA